MRIIQTVRQALKSPLERALETAARVTGIPEKYGQIFSVEQYQLFLALQQLSTQNLPYFKKLVKKNQVPAEALLFRFEPHVWTVDIGKVVRHLMHQDDPLIAVGDYEDIIFMPKHVEGLAIRLEAPYPGNWLVRPVYEDKYEGKRATKVLSGFEDAD